MSPDVRARCLMAQSVEVLAVGDAKEESRPAPRTWPSSSELRVLGVGDYLFKEAEPRKYIYRVEKGVVAVFERRIGRPANIVEMAGQGDYVALGSLEHHRDNARAVVESIVAFLPRSQFAQLAEGDPKLGQKQDEALERDFEYGKLLANDRGQSTPVERVAAFLMAISRQNAHEGRNPTIVSDTLKCGIVASLLDLDIETLASALLKLQDIGLVEQYPGAGLRLKEIEALERMADGDLQDIGATAFQSMPAGAVIAPQLTAISGAVDFGSWRQELREAIWLVSVVGGLSAISVGTAVMIAIALQ